MLITRSSCRYLLEVHITASPSSPFVPCPSIPLRPPVSPQILRNGSIPCRKCGFTRAFTSFPGFGIELVIWSGNKMISWWIIIIIQQLSKGLIFMDVIFIDAIFIDAIFTDAIFIDAIFIDAIFIDVIFIDVIFIDVIFILLGRKHLEWTTRQYIPEKTKTIC